MINLLLIEDSRVTQEVIKAYLINYVKNDPIDSFNFFTAETLTDGLKIININKIDLVLLDLTLPDTESPIDTIKNFTPVRKIPTIIVSGLNIRSFAHEALSWGVKDYILKEDLERLGPLIFKTLNDFEKEEILKEQHEALQALRETVKKLEDRIDAMLKMAHSDETVIAQK